MDKLPKDCQERSYKIILNNYLDPWVCLIVAINLISVNFCIVLPQPNTVVNHLSYLVFRKKLIRGEVHDPTAYLFGNVAGHAGLFSII